MPKFRKKPVVIEAVEFIGSNAGELARWIGEAVVESNHTGIVIATREGEMRADPGDWIICGVKGEFYPCKPDVFAITYEPATGLD